MEDKNSLDGVRHSLAHLLAIAVLEQDPKAKLGIGPTIDNGFYYDFELSEGYTPDLSALKKRMQKLIKEKLDFTGKEVTVDEAKKLFADQPYKQELLAEFAEEGKTLTAYTTGDFTDLCKGGHVENTSEIQIDAFKLTHIAGAYWRGDEKNKMLTRIYGIAFNTKDELKAYEAMLLEAKKRDHRKIGKELDLFTFSDLIGSGLPLFTPKGTAMRTAIIDKIQNLQKQFGYEAVSIPHITKKDLYETSGHWEKFGDELFKVKGASDAEFVMKPMNCPHHTQIYASQPRSYKDLPIRYAEATMVYRDEQAGELLGLSRVRSITQDDGHAFCRMEDIEGEAHNIVSIIKDFYSLLGMFNEGDYWVSLSVRDPKTPEKYLGDEEKWKMAEEMLEKVAKEAHLDYKKVEGEAAFYGPKLDFMFKDALGREWQLGTIQLDFVLPERFNLTYTDSDGVKKTPVIIHRAIAGSLERFMSVIIEHFAGNFPLWLSPVQIKIIPIADVHNEYARGVYDTLVEAGIRVEIDDTKEGFGKKVRAGKVQKIPYMIIIGEEEVSSNQITLESRDEGKIGQMSVGDLLKNLSEEIKIGKPTEK